MEKYGVITAMESEMAAITDRLAVSSVDTRAGLMFVLGNIAGRSVVCTVCGMGKVNAAMAAQAMTDAYSPDCIINVGVAGGLSPEVSHGTVVVADTVCYHDVITDGLGDVYPYMQPFDADVLLIEAAVAAAGDCATVGGIVTGDEFVTSAAKSRLLREKYGACACEMEGAAIAHVAKCNGLPFCIIRAISDMADEDSPDTFAEFEHTAAKQAADIVIGMIERG